MGYQALLFSADEKTARSVTQILRELEFTVISFTEPSAAVNKLQSQQFDAVVVDCENEQNATLLFKTARSASNNDVSLAVAVVEGQTGVARAFRIGASLVLTKPINAEQAKGTLRVARGLLRKSKAAKPAAAAATDAKPTVAAVSKAAAAAAGASAGSTPHESAQSRAAASSGSDAAEPIIELFDAAEKGNSTEIAASTVHSTPGKHAEKSASGVGSGAASAPARAREVESVSSNLSQTKSVASTKDKVSSTPSKPETAEISVASENASAAKAELPAAKTSAKSSGSKKAILGAAAVVLIAAGGYEVWIQGGQLGIWGEPARTTTAPAHAAASATTHAVPEAASVPAGALSSSTSTAKPTPSVAANSASIPAAAVATAPLPQPMNVSPEISQALLLKKTQPAYPPNALPSHLEGAVKLSATISPAGDVSAVKVISGDPLLAPAAVDAVKQWKYKPYVLSGTPIAIQTPVTVNFKAPK